jgi:hypothetical protein
LKTSDLCLVAQQRYGEFGLPVVLGAAKMEKSKFMKYLSIARDGHLRRIQPLLPASFSSIHLMVQLSDKAFEEAVKADLIRPDVRRGEIEALRKPIASKGKRAAEATDLPAALKEMAPGGHLAFAVPDDLDADACEQVRRVLHKLQKAFGVQIVSTKDLDPTPKAGPTQTITSKAGGSPVNKPTMVQEPIAPPKGASLPEKSSS